jgi:DUF1680 family protein
MMMSKVRGPIDVQKSPNARLRPLPTAATLTGGFAGKRQTANRSVSIPHGHEQLEKAGNYRNMRIAAGRESDGFTGGWPFQDSDIFKFQEALGFEIGNGSSDELQSTLTSTADLVASAQESNGYLNTWYQIKKEKPRFSSLIHDHEMYNAGHLMQAAVAAHRNANHATLMDVSIKFADLLYDEFGPGKKEGLCGHPEIETALFELSRETGDKRYADLSGAMIDRRGRHLLGGRKGDVYHQDHKPVREVEELAGHAVRQLYLNAGVVDLFLESGEKALLDAQVRLFDDLEQYKLYVNGGIGAKHEGEAFGKRYELPNESAYCETCAQLAGFFWAWRMLLATGHGRYADLMELLFFNSIVSGVSLSGSEFFYVNPLATRGGHGRQSWFPCACCPPNVMRTLSSLGHYVATTDRDGVQLHQYFAGTLVAGDFRLSVQTDYPWTEGISIRVEAAPPTAQSVSLRIPTWCEAASIKVNGSAVAVKQESVYATLHRAWKQGDTIELMLPMKPVWVEAHPAVESVRGQVALQRGPITFCVESIDLPDGISPDWLIVDPSTPVTIQARPDLLGGIVTGRFEAKALDPSRWTSRLYRKAGETKADRRVDVTAVPYAVWCNRGAGAMRVWLRGG